MVYYAILYFIILYCVYNTIPKSALATAKPHPAAARPRGARGSAGQRRLGSLNHSVIRNTRGKYLLLGHFDVIVWRLESPAHFTGQSWISGMDAAFCKKGHPTSTKTLS